MSTASESTKPEFISAVSSSSMNYEAERPAFVINPEADKRDLLSWCITECNEMEHLATVGAQEVFAGDPARTVAQLGGRLEVLSNVLHRMASIEKPAKDPLQSQSSMH